MPIHAQVEGVGTLEFPDDTDPAVVQKTVQQVLAGRDMQKYANRWPAQSGAYALSGGSAGDNAASTFKSVLGDVMRGSVDVLGGGAQIASRAANTIAPGLVPASNPGGLIAGPLDVQAQNAQARANIDQMLGPGSPGFSPVRVAAGAALTAPLTPTKFLQAPTILGRMGGAGVAGGTAGLLQEVPDAKNNTDFWQKKALQGALGAGFGALSQPVAEGVVHSVVGALNALTDKGVAAARNMTGANSLDQIVNLTREALKKTGISYDDLGDAVKQGLVDDVQKAMGGYSGVNPSAIARLAAFRQEGFDNPLRHWISKDPSEFTAIENLSHTPQGGPLKDQMNALDTFVMNKMNTLRGNPVDPLAAGDLIKGDLNNYLQQQRGKTNVLYDTFRDIAPDVTGNPQRFVNDVYGGLEGKMALGSLPTGIQNIVNGISKGEIPLTPSTLYQLQKMAKPGADGTTNYALGHLSRAIDREMSAISDSLPGNASRDASTMPVPQGYKGPSATNMNDQGQYAADVLKMARAQHAQTVGSVEDSRILTKADAGVPSDNFASDFLKSDIRDVAKNWNLLSDDSKAALRSQVMGDIRGKVFGGATDDSGKAAAQAALNSYLSDPNNVAKLRIVLGNDGTEQVKRLALMLESAKVQPSGSAVNNSHTGGAVVGNALKLGDYLANKGIWGGVPLQGFARDAAVSNAMTQIPDVLGRRSLMIDPATEELLGRRAGRAMGLLGGAGAYTGLLGSTP